jgi:hypothetical protein
MVAGTWFNQDGLYLQFGTQKAVEEVGGDYLVYGETREIEQLIPLVPMAIGPGTSIQVPAPPTTFSGTTTAIAAGIQSLTTQVPLQITPVTTVSGGILNFTTTQVFIEHVEVDTLVGATGGTSISVGLVANTTPVAGTNTTFVQCTPNAGVQLINGLLTSSMATSGQRVTFTQPGATAGFLWSTPGTGVAGGGAWLGTMPLVTNALTPLPAFAWISTIASGAFTNGLIKLRVRYTLYGSISQ